VPCMIQERADQMVPFTLISEYPDETVYGEAFRLGHDTQMRTVLAAIEAWRELEPAALRACESIGHLKVCR